MATQSSIYNTDSVTRTFPSTKHIATQQHCRVYVKTIATIDVPSTWVMVNMTEYELINNSIVFNIAPNSGIYQQIEVRVADAEDELEASISDIGIVADNLNAITILADNINLLSTNLNREYIVDSLPLTATHGDLAVNVLDGAIYEWQYTMWVKIAQSAGGSSTSSAVVTTVTSLPASALDGTLVFNTPDGLLYSYINGMWQTVVAPPQSLAVVGIEVYVTNPSTGNFEGRVIFNSTSNQLLRYTAGAWIQVVEPTTAAATVADGSLTTAKFATGLRIVEVVDVLPTVGNSIGRLALLTTNGQLYRYTATGWTNEVPTTALTGTITSTQIGPNSVTTGALAVGAVTADTIAVNAITTDKIAANAITAGTISAGAVGATQIAANAITTDKLAAGSITADKIAVGAISAVSISAGSITSDMLSANAVTAGKIAAGAVSTSQLAAGAVTATQIAAGSITADKLAVGSITADRIIAGQIDATKLTLNGITIDRMAANQTSLVNVNMYPNKLTGSYVNNTIYTIFSYTYTIPSNVVANSRCFIETTTSLLNDSIAANITPKIKYTVKKNGSNLNIGRENKYTIPIATNSTNLGADDFYKKLITTVSAGDTINVVMTLTAPLYAPSLVTEDTSSIITVLNKTT